MITQRRLQPQKEPTVCVRSVVLRLLGQPNSLRLIRATDQTLLSFDKPDRALEHVYNMLPLGRKNLRVPQKGLGGACFQEKDIWN